MIKLIKLFIVIIDNPNNPSGFNEAIDQIDALYNNLDVQTNEDYLDDRFISQQRNNNSSTTYDFSKPTSTTNRRKHLSQNSNEYSKRYSSTGFQHIPSQYEQNNQIHLRHLVHTSMINDVMIHIVHLVIMKI